MVNAIKQEKNNILFVRLIGSIEETVNFDELLGPAPSEMEINCKEIPRINSVGVKAWIKYFQNCHKKGTVLRFTECSIAIVEQINLISNFTCGGSVESIFLPFSCSSCKSELIALYKTADLKKLQLKLPEFKCTKCSNPANFDDILEEYLAFLIR